MTVFEQEPNDLTEVQRPDFKPRKDLGMTDTKDSASVLEETNTKFAAKFEKPKLKEQSRVPYISMKHNGGMSLKNQAEAHPQG